MKQLAIPATRNHRQLAAWVNGQRLVDLEGRSVSARVEATTTNTDTRVAGTRFRREGAGRRGLALEIWLDGASLLDPTRGRLFRHVSSESYRKHSEAREWVATNLRRKARR